MHEGEVARLQPVEVAQHLVLGVVPLEDLVGQEGAGARMGRLQLRLGPATGGGKRGLVPAPEALEQGEEIGVGHGLVEGHPDRSVLVPPQVDPPVAAPGEDALSPPGVHPHPQGVEERIAAQVEPQATEATGQEVGQAVHAPGDGPQAVRSVVDRVHPGHDREQDLGRADVARGLVAPDVLLSGLQGEAVGRAALGVVRHPDQPARDLPLVLVPRGQVGGVRPSEARGDPEALGGAHRDVGPELAGGAQQGEGEDVGRRHE